MRVRWRDFSKGWWPQGPREAMPPGTLRRARGISAIKTGTLRSRWGSTELYDFDAHSLYRFRGVRYQGSGTLLLKNGVVIRSGLSGARLRFMRMPPAPGNEDYLFVAGGGSVFKIAPDGAVSQWGIEAPTTDPTVAAGAAGALTGVYKVAVTFLNNTTGVRSNPNPSAFTAPTTVTVAAQKIEWTHIPVSDDPQVTTVELWRTSANLTQLFKLTEVTNGVTTHSDNTPDTDLQSLTLLFDNLPPVSTTSDAMAPYAGRMWTLDSGDGQRGRVFYSPIGRPESVEGFIEINNGDDPCLRLEQWGGALYCWTNAHVIQVVGFTTPFTWRSVFGSPGLTSTSADGSAIDTRFTVTPTPFGLFYHAADGIRLFDGTQSRLFAFDNIARLLTGEALEEVPAFEPVIGAFNGRELWLSDAAFTTLALDPQTATWRVAGGPNESFYFEPETQKLTASEGAAIVVKEPPEVTTDDGAVLAFEIETAGTFTDEVVLGMVQRLYFDVNTAGQFLTPTLVLDDVEYVLPAFKTTERPRQAVEYEIGRWGRVMSVRLEGLLTETVEVFGIGDDTYVPSYASSAEEARAVSMWRGTP